MNVATGIKQIRLKLELTQNAVCDRSQLTQGFYSMLENGISPPSFDTLEKLCNAFQVPMIMIIWLGTEKKDIPKKMRPLFDQMKPIMDELINQLTEKQ